MSNPENHSETGAGREPNPYLSQAYTEVCLSYRAVDDIRIKLLGFLPIASAGGVFLLIRTDDTADPAVFVAAGIFGSLVALGLFAYELFGIKRCHALIEAGKAIEEAMRLGLEPTYGAQFIRRPDPILGAIAEPLATALIYPAVLASWLYVALVEVVDDTNHAIWVASGTFLLGLFVVQAYALKLRGEPLNPITMWRRRKARKASPDAAANPQDGIAAGQTEDDTQASTQSP